MSDKFQHQGEHRCVCCGCTEITPCVGGPQGRCWWTYIDNEGDGLCSQCAAIPLDDLIYRLFNIHVADLYMNQVAHR